jgi:hypothetical protein
VANAGFIVQFGSTDDPFIPWAEQQVSEGRDGDNDNDDDDRDDDDDDDDDDDGRRFTRVYNRSCTNSTTGVTSRMSPFLG